MCVFCLCARQTRYRQDHVLRMCAGLWTVNGMFYLRVGVLLCVRLATIWVCEARRSLQYVSVCAHVRVCLARRNQQCVACVWVGVGKEWV